jgi:hypothetical protein
MKKYLSSILVSLGIITAGVTMLAPVQPVYAINVFENGCQGSTGGTSSGATGQICGSAKSETAEKFPQYIKNIINTMIFLIGIIAVIMIVVGGVRYVVSNGESAQIKAAKDTITYAVIGLVVAVMAFAIVNFVLAQFK